MCKVRWSRGGGDTDDGGGGGSGGLSDLVSGQLQKLHKAAVAAFQERHTSLEKSISHFVEQLCALCMNQC